MPGTDGIFSGRRLPRLSVVAAPPDDPGAAAIRGGGPEPGTAWLVRHGYVDLFAVMPPFAGRGEGRRHHVLRAGPGEAILGLPAGSAAEAGLLLIAVGALDAAVSVVSSASLLAERQDAVLDGWCRGLASALETADAPPGWLAVVGEERSLAPGDVLGGDPAQLLWVVVTEGAVVASFGAIAGKGGAPWLLLPPRGWLRAEGAATVRVHTRDAALADDPAAVALALDGFHACVAARLAAEIGAGQAARDARLRAQRQGDVAVLAAGLRRIASGGEQVPVSPVHAGEDPCLSACRIAADACGITLPAWSKADDRGPAQETTVERVERIAAAAHLRCRRVLLAADWWRRDRGVMIGVDQETGSPCVLLPGRDGYRRIDPMTGTAAPISRGQGLWVEAVQIYRALPDGPVRLRDLLRLALRGTAGDAALFIVMALVTGLLTLLPPLAAGLLFDQIIPHDEAGRVLEVAGGLAVLAISGSCFELAKAVALVRIEGRLSLVAQSALIDRLLRLPARFFATYATGDLANRLLGIEEIRRTLTSTTVITLLTGAMSLFSLALLFVLAPVLAALCSATLAAALVATLLLNLLSLRWERHAMRERGRLEGLVVQLVIGLAKLRVAAAERRAMAVWLDRAAHEQDSANRVQSLQTGLAVLVAILPLAGLGTLFAGATLLGGNGRLPIGTFMAFNAALGNLLAAVLAIAMQLTGALRSIPLYERALPLLRGETETRGGGRAGALRGAIELRDVTFGYDAHGPPVLDRLSLRIEAQEYVAIVGGSGSGKSTLLRLLLGFEQPQSGAVLFDGTAQEQFDPAALRRCMGVVLQQSRLSPGNLFQNIVGTGGWSLDDAWAAARLAGLAEDIERMPMGMHTTVLEGGQGLSGGQRQRLLIARALVARPRILLFDEATSALDNRTQDIVSTALASLPATRVVIAHRLTTIARAHRVLVLDRGRLVQSGSYADLLAQPGPFARLAERQLV